jgi:hypothetical protein
MSVCHLRHGKKRGGEGDSSRLKNHYLRESIKGILREYDLFLGDSLSKTKSKSKFTPPVGSVLVDLIKKTQQNHM